MTDIKTRLVALSAYVYERTRARMEGMTDEEYGALASFPWAGG